MLAGSKQADRREQLRDLWADLTTPTLPPPFDGPNAKLSLFGNPGCTPRASTSESLALTSFTKRTRSGRRWTKHVDFEKLRPENFARPPGERAPRLILTATNLVSGKLDRFDSQEMALTPEHVAASGSLPPSFPMTSANAPGGRQMPYWDGGLFDNTPLSKVIGALQESPDPDKTMYVVNLFPVERAPAAHHAGGDRRG